MPLRYFHLLHASTEHQEKMEARMADGTLRPSRNKARHPALLGCLMERTRVKRDAGRFCLTY